MRIFESTLVLFIISLAVLAVVHSLAMQWSLYYLYPWFDIPMHFWGGALVALGCQTALFAKLSRIPSGSLPRTLAVVLCVSVAWEIFEWNAGIGLIVEHYRTIFENYQIMFIADTLKDLLLDLIGGVVGYFTGRALTTHLH